VQHLADGRRLAAGLRDGGPNTPNAPEREKSMPLEDECTPNATGCGGVPDALVSSGWGCGLPGGLNTSRVSGRP
jgi:hypothetical protein